MLIYYIIIFSKNQIPLSSSNKLIAGDISVISLLDTSNFSSDLRELNIISK
jgi:hypothetical protein